MIAVAVHIEWRGTDAAAMFIFRSPNIVSVVDRFKWHIKRKVSEGIEIITRWFLPPVLAY